MPSELAAAPQLSPEDVRRIEALRARDEATFAALVREYGPTMLRVARLFARDRAVAEEVVQEAWVGVLRGIDRFEGRSSLKTWVFRILTNTAKTRAEREGRSIPFSSLGPAEHEEPAVDPDRFRGPDERGPGHWADPPRSWAGRPEERLLAAETRDVIRTAVDALPAQQRTVVSLRDIEGWSSDEVCNALGLSETNQRVLLHRARSRVRRALERYMEGS